MIWIVNLELWFDFFLDIYEFQFPYFLTQFVYFFLTWKRKKYLSTWDILDFDFNIIR